MVDHFLDMAVQGGGPKGFIMLLDGHGWGRFPGELSKVLAFFEVMKGPPFSGPGPGVETVMLKPFLQLLRKGVGWFRARRRHCSLSCGRGRENSRRF